MRDVSFAHIRSRKPQQNKKKKKGKARSDILQGMRTSFSLPPRCLFSREERRINFAVERARSEWTTEEGLRLVHSLQGRHPEMMWLAKLFPLESLDGEWRLPEGVAEEQLSKWCAAHPEDARALAYLAKVRGSDLELLARAISMGDAWAMSWIVLCSPVSDDKRFYFLSASAEQEDATGTYELSCCYGRGLGCKKNAKLADELFQRAVDLGSSSAFCNLLQLLKDPADKVKLMCNFVSVASYYIEGFIEELKVVIQRHVSEEKCGSAIFEAGEVMKGNIDLENNRVFGKKHNPDRIALCDRAVAMYDRWCYAAREACVAWILTSNRIGIVKDTRKMIAKMVWEARVEARGALLC